jgi:AraC-like DNA-binding protein
LIAGLNEQDQQFVDKLKTTVAEHYADPGFTRPQLAKQLGFSDRQICRKLSAIMDQGFSDYLRRYRLGEAAVLINTGLQINQVFEQVGFSSPSYFSACFKAEFGMTPTQFQAGEG